MRKAADIERAFDVPPVRERYIFRAGEFEVAVHIRTRVKDRRHPFRIITDQIGKLRDAFGLTRMALN